MGFGIFVTYFDVFRCLYDGVYWVGEFIIRHIYHMLIHTENDTNQHYVFKSGNF